MNLFLIISIFLICDFICFIQTYNLWIGHTSDLNFQFKEYIKSLKYTDFDEEYNRLKSEGLFRDTIVKNPKKKPILIFGCSFANGDGLENEQTFSTKLSKRTNRSVYNRAYSSLGIQYMPYFLEHYEIEKGLAENPEYIIFIMIDNHIFRLYRAYYNVLYFVPDKKYKISKNNELVEYNYNDIFLQKSIMYKHLLGKIAEFKTDNGYVDKNFDFIKLHFLKAKKLIDEKFPSSKLVILRYEEEVNNPIWSSERWKELEDEGIIVIDSYSLTNEHLNTEEYRLSDNVHPNEKAWDLIVPKLVEMLNL